MPLAPLFREPSVPPDEPAPTPEETPREAVIPPRMPFGFATTVHDATTAGAPLVATTVHDATPDPRTAALMARNAARSAARLAAIEEIRVEGLSIEDVVDRYGVTEKTARRWIQQAER
jgi:DNA-directed RNA polymerase specialized sigma24 family protein